MIELTCWACRGDVRVSNHFAGLQLACGLCGAVNPSPPPATEEVDVAAWLAAIDADSEAVTVEVDIRGWPVVAI